MNLSASPVLRNQAGLGRLPDPALSGTPVIFAAELCSLGNEGWPSLPARDRLT